MGEKIIYKSGDIYSIYFFYSFFLSPYIYNKKNVILYIFLFVYIIFIHNYIYMITFGYHILCKDYNFDRL